MAKVRGQGQLQHHFWREYSATIALVFKDAASAKDALTKLPGFKVSPKEPSALIFHGGGDEFAAAKAALTSFRVPSTDRRGSHRIETSKCRRDMQRFLIITAAGPFCSVYALSFTEAERIAEEMIGPSGWCVGTYEV